jgi:hypothetical protein
VLPDFKDEVDNTILKLKKSLNKDTISVKEFIENADCSVGPLIKFYGSPAKALTTVCGETFKRKIDEIPTDVLLLDVKYTANKLGVNRLTVKDYDDHGTYSISTLANRFGNITAAFIAAGLEVDNNYIHQNELMSDLLCVANKLGVKSLTAEEYDDNGKYSSSTISKRFGTFVRGLQLCGLTQKPKNTSRIYSKDQLLILLKKFNKEYGRVPTVRDFRDPLYKHYPSDKTYYYNFPGKIWAEILMLAGLKSENKHLGLDGEYYDSLSEMKLANILFSSYISYAPHIKPCKDRQWKCDFYLPDQNLWIEYDGLEERRRNPEQYQEKLDYYRTNNFNFIELHEGDDILEKCGLYIESKELLIQIITFNEANEFLARNHYLGNASRGAKYYGGFVVDKLVGVIGLGKVANPKETSLAITRIAWLDIVRKDRNFGSRFISKTLKQSGYSGKIVSWSDPRFHSGTLYKACNFTEIKTKARTDYVYIDVDGNEYHKSYCRVPAGQSEPKYAESLGLIKIIVPPKQKWSITI